MEGEMMQIKDVVKRARKSMGLKQYEMAYMLGVSDHTISKLESGKSIPKVKTLREMSKFLGVNLFQVLADEYAEEIRTSSGGIL